MNNNISKKDIEGLLHYSFSELDSDLVSNLLDKGKIVTYEPREEIITQGEFSKDVFLLITGKLKVSWKDEFQKETVINEISTGEFFGETPVFTGEARSATIFAARNSTLLKIEGTDFQEILDGSAKLTKYLGATIIKRLQHSREDKERVKLKHIVIQSIDKQSESSVFIDNLETKLNRFGKVLHVSKKDFYGEIKQVDENDFEELSSKFNHWLYSQDKEHDFLLLESDFENTDWSKLCLGQADSIMLLGGQELSTELTEMENYLFNTKRVNEIIDVHLVVDSSNGGNISGISKLLGNRYIKNIFYHKSPSDLGRIARFISGNSIKLVLGGGGAKGFAHIGVYKAMLELDIPVDFVGGTSIGSVIAASIAMGWSYEDLVEKAHQSFVVDKPLKDFQWPIVSFLSGNKLEKIIHRNFGDKKIEELEIPFYAIAANLSKASTEILDKGKVSDAIRASISLPIFLPPFVKDNSLLLDGGIVDNLPYDHVQSLAIGPTIGVDLSFLKVRELGYEKIPSNKKIYLNKFSKKKKLPVPRIHQIMMSTLTLASNAKRISNSNKFDVYIKPNVSKYGFLKWDNFEALVEEGYQSSLPILKAWKEKNYK
ncbi:MAG: patatin-like phospholipase family protein [Flavobacteriales bacterium]